MLSEGQCHIIGFCKYDDCGAELWDGDDVRFPEWIDGDPDCLHCLPGHSHGEDDSDLAVIDAEMGKIVERINKTTEKINEMPPFNLVKWLDIVDGTETIKVREK